MKRQFVESHFEDETFSNATFCKTTVLSNPSRVDLSEVQCHLCNVQPFIHCIVSAYIEE